MSDKIHFIALVFVILLFSVVAFKISADESVALEQAKSNIISLIQNSNYAEANVQTQELSTDLSLNPALLEALFEIAEKYRESNRYEEEKAVFQQIIKNYPDGPYASKAQLGFQRAEILSFIVSQNYQEAEKATDELVTDELVTDFSGHPDLPDALYQTAERYRWVHEFDRAEDLYQQIIQDYQRMRIVV